MNIQHLDKEIFGKREDIRFVSEELEGCWLVAFINDVQEPVRHRCQLHLSEMD